MFKKLMAKLGVGSAKVDLVLSKQEYSLGERVEGQFHIAGGTVEQRVNQICVDLVLKMQVRGKEFSKLVTTIDVAPSFVIHANEKRVFPFVYDLPNNLPIARGGISYGFVTHLDIAAGVDQLDHDFIQVLAPARFDRILKAFESLGLREKMDSGMFNGFSQEFVFFAPTPLFGQVKEVEFIAGIAEDGIQLQLGVDRSPSTSGGEDLKQEIFLENELLDDVQALAAHLQETIEEMLDHAEQYPASRYPKKQGFSQGRHGGGFAGVMGGFAAGMFGGMLLEEMMDGMFGDTLFGDDGSSMDDSGGDGFDFGDFFGGGDGGF